MPQYRSAPAPSAPASVGPVVATSGLMMMPHTAGIMAHQQSMVDAASQLHMLQQQQQQQQQQQHLLRPGLVPGMIPGLPMQQLGGVPVSMALPGLVSQPQVWQHPPPLPPPWAGGRPQY